MIETISFDSHIPGPRVLFFGAIHGNETCGPTAMHRVVSEISHGLKLVRGSVTFVPVCNVAARQKNVRQIDQNLNRVFRPTTSPTSYEQKLANELCQLVDACTVMLDVHSTSESDQPFLYLDFPSPENDALARVLGPEIAIVGWPELYERLGPAHESYDTTTYAHSQGKTGLLIECGLHGSASADEIAYRAIINTLRHFDVTEGKPETRQPTRIHMSDVFFRNEGEQFAKPWKHLQPVTKGEPLITSQAELVGAPYDGFVIMPFSNSPIGEDWLYLGRS